MAEPLPKRRRLDSGVHKPFVSPLKHRPGDSTATPPPKAASNAGIFKKPALPATPGRASTPHTPTPLRTAHTPINKLTSVNTASTVTPTSNASTHSTIALQSELTALRTSLDTLRQAQRLLSQKATSASITASNSNTSDLSTLTSKWQAATRLAVEELYTSAVERMNRLGGVSAWREGERQKKERMEEWRRDDERIEEERVLNEMDRELVGQIGGAGGGDSDDDDGEGGQDEESGRSGRKKERKRERKAEQAELQARREEMVAARTEAREIARAEREEDGYEAEQKREEEEMDRARGLVGDDNDSYTMSMMLTQLNIDMDIIGYDKDAQRWKE